MIQKLIDNMPHLTESILSFLTMGFNKMLLKTYSDVLGIATNPNVAFFNDPIVQGIIAFSQWAAYAAMAVSILFMIVDYGEDLAAGKNIALSEMLMNIFKGFIFCLIAPQLGLFSLQIGRQLATSLDLSAYLQANYTIMANLSVLWVIVSVVALVVFVFMSARQFGMMLIHIATYVLYVPGVVRGDSESMGAWIRQTVAIALTYLCQYVMFYFGLYFMVQGRIFGGIIGWSSMAAVKTVLNKFGMSSGFAGGSQVVSLAAQGLRLAR